MNVEIERLYLAYRKAKAERFYEREHPGLLELSLYEEDLVGNLKSLQKRLAAGDNRIWTQSEFLGTYGYLPKSVTVAEASRNELITIHSSSEEQWDADNLSRKASIDFRLVGFHSVDFHVVSALWLMDVGVQFDSALGSSCFGSRMKVVRGKRPRVNDKAIGLFKSYSVGFRQWREGGLKAAGAALGSDQSIAAVTADLRKFYHRTAPAFILNERFLAEAGVDLTTQQRKFTQNLLAAMAAWAKQTPDHRKAPASTLPVGLSASRTIANVALLEFDRFVEQELEPLFYGRYVDDVILVLRNAKKWRTAEDVWSHIIERSKGIVVRGSERGEDGKDDAVFRLNLAGLESSDLVFAGKKQKVFLLKGSSGRTHLNSIRETVTRRTSEWRLLPELPENAASLMQDFIQSSDDWSEDADHLRKSDSLSIRRLSFAIRLRNLEGVDRAIPPTQWVNQRRVFFEIVHDYVVAPRQLPVYAPYIPRLIGLAASARDWSQVERLLKRLFAVFDWLEKHHSEHAAKIANCQEFVFRRCTEAFLAASKPQPEASSRELKLRSRLFRTLRRGCGRFWSEEWEVEESGWWRRLFGRDLAREPFRAVFTGRLDVAGTQPSADMPIALRSQLDMDPLQEFLAEAFPSEGRDASLPAGIAYPTRPFALNELTQLLPRLLEDEKGLLKLQIALRGGGGRVTLPRLVSSRSGFKQLGIRSSGLRSDRRIAITCFETSDESWKRMARGEADPEWGRRFFRFNHLINQILKHNEYAGQLGVADGSGRRRDFTKIDYVVLPELAVPSHWVTLFARSLAKSGISLIAGVEYVPHPGVGPCAVGGPFGLPPSRRVSNQVYLSLVTDPLYSSFVTLIQEKALPALREEHELAVVADAALVPIRNPHERLLVHHGEFAFSVLICSELLNLDYRAALRGVVDALFVPEWNSDIDSFSALVEATALDVHCYMVQVNNRQFGDCRIRGPYKEAHKRDVARIRGGESDYFVVGRVEVDALRRFQSAHRSPASPFKPVPDGFRISKSRGSLP